MRRIQPERGTTGSLREKLEAAVAGRYAVEREAGRGGMAAVFLARGCADGRRVAIKVLYPELAHALGPTRFHREIEFIRRLDHPNIVPVLESDEAAGGRGAGGLLYYVMPRAGSETLQDRLLREGQLPLESALAILRDVAAAVDHAHAHNIVHRDIKPANILLDGDRALVCDFGVARAIVAAAVEPVSSSGLVVGTPTYMSPEQAACGTVDGRCDIYALGCVAYEMLAGEPPFTGPTTQAILARHVSERPRAIRVVRPEVPAHVEAAVLAALAKVPGERPGSGAELVGLVGAGGAD